MPTYSYKCELCSCVFEHTKHMTEPDPKNCPFCGKSDISKIFTVPNLIPSGKVHNNHPSVSQKIQPNGRLGTQPYYSNHRGGLNAISYVNGVGYVEHPNLACSPPGCDSKDGRIVIVENEKK